MDLDMSPEGRLDAAIKRTAQIKTSIRELQARFDAAEAEVVQLLAELGQKTRDAGNYKCTVVRTETLVFDESGLKRAIGAVQFNKLTNRKLDRKKLEAAVEAGTVDRVVVAQNSLVKEGSPYLRITEKQ
jgi:hypothetical protein